MNNENRKGKIKKIRAISLKRNLKKRKKKNVNLNK